MVRVDGNPWLERRSGSLLGLNSEQVRGWIAWYCEAANLRCSLERLLVEAGKVEGTVKALTKTKVRKAARRISAGR